MPLNPLLMRIAWVIQKNYLSTLFFLAGLCVVSYLWISNSEERRINALLHSEKFDPEALKELVYESNAETSSKNIVGSAIDAASKDKDPALVSLAIKQVKQVLGRD